MNRSLRAQMYRAVARFLAAAGIVLFVLAVALSLRESLFPPRDTWPAWTSGTIALLSLVAVTFWVVGALLSRHAHRERRDTAATFLTRDERERVIGEIRSFESRTSGEIRVHFEERTEESATRAAVRVFERIGMTATRERNGVLFFVAVRDRRFAVVGDTGINDVTPEDFWAGIMRRVESRFAEGRYADGLIEGIDAAGDALVRLFPPRPVDANELPDGISESPRDNPK